MLFGITVDGDVFQRKLDQCFGKIDQVIVIADDIMIVGKQQIHKDHDIALTNLIETARKCNIRLNFDKLQYKRTEVEFFVKTYTTDGHKPATSKMSAIVEMPAPTCKKQVQSFIGMVNYLSKFSARLSELAEPIRELSKEKVPFNWGPEHQEEFKQMKKEIVRAPILALYNPKKETILQTDASIKGLGICLFQEQRPVYFACKENHWKPSYQNTKSSNTKAAKNLNQNIPLQLYGLLYTRHDQSTCRLLVSNGGPKRFH